MNDVCDCKARLEKELTERFKTNVPEATGHSVTLQGYGFVIVNNTMGVAGYMPYNAVAAYPLKKGGTKQKTSRGNMTFSFCPFCGLAAKP